MLSQYTLTKEHPVLQWLLIKFSTDARRKHPHLDNTLTKVVKGNTKEKAGQNQIRPLSPLIPDFAFPETRMKTMCPVLWGYTRGKQASNMKQPYIVFNTQALPKDWKMTAAAL